MGKWLSFKRYERPKQPHVHELPFYLDVKTPTADEMPEHGSLWECSCGDKFRVVKWGYIGSHPTGRAITSWTCYGEQYYLLPEGV